MVPYCPCSTLNRTILELKSAEAAPLLLAEVTLNRTILELKYGDSKVIYITTENP